MLQTHSGEASYSPHVAERVFFTGDRPNGPMHIGHFVGSMRSRLEYQGRNKQHPDLEPIRRRRQALSADPGEVLNILKQGSERARSKTAETLEKVKEAMGLKYS